MLQERIAQVQAKIRTLIAQYQSTHNLELPEIQVRFDLRGRSAGVAGRRGTNYYMRFNRDMMLNEGWDHLINDTVPHELAHIICFVNGKDFAHGAWWRATCVELGGNGERCHKEAVVYAKGNTYVYTTSTGRTVNLSETKHRRIQQGQSYIGRHGLGSINHNCAYSLLGSATVVTPTVSPKPVPVQPKPVHSRDFGTSNADLVRGRIQYAKAQGLGSSDVVNYAVTTLGMSLSLAKTYTRNNWHKV